MSSTTQIQPKRIPATPWGMTDHEHEIAEGIISVSTSSHGGYWLSPDRVEHLTKLFPGYRPYAGYPWLEEDLDVSAAMLAWPELFGTPALRAAVRTVRCDFDSMKPLAEWLDTTPEGTAIKAKVQQWEQTHADQWERLGLSSAGNGWVIDFRRIGDRAERIVRMEQYPTKHLYTAAELDALDMGPEPAFKERLRQQARYYEPDLEIAGAIDACGNVTSDADPGL